MLVNLSDWNLVLHCHAKRPLFQVGMLGTNEVSVFATNDLSGLAVALFGLRVSPGIGPRGMRFLTIAGLAAFGLFRAGFDRAAERHVCGF